MKTWLPVVLLILMCSISGATEPIAVSTPGKMGTIIFTDKSSFSTTLYGLRYVGQLKAKNKLPFLVLAGRGCDECDANTSIYIHSPSDGPMKSEDSQTRYSYPGRYKDNETDKLVEKTRCFIGKCIPGQREGVAWYMQWLDEKSKWQSGFYIAEIASDVVKAKYLTQPEAKLKETLSLVKQGICREIKGVTGYTEP